MCAFMYAIIGSGGSRGQRTLVLFRYFGDWREPLDSDMQSHHFWRRPDDEPVPLQPLVLRSVADRSFAPWQQEDSHHRPYHKLQWCVSGWAEVRQSGHSLRLEAGQAIYFPADTEHWARAGEDGWRSCWMTFGPGAAEAIISSFGLQRRGLINAGPCPVNDFKRLEQAARRIGQDADRQCGVFMYGIVSKAAAQIQKQNDDQTVAAALQLLQKSWADPGFGIAELALRCGVHRSQLSRRFSADVGLSPSRYLLRLRLQQATRLLLADELRSSEIAEECGFNDSSYFARVFRRSFGISPQQYRRRGDS